MAPRPPRSSIRYPRASRGELVLGNVVRAAATTQAVIDGFVAISVLTAVALLIVVFRSAAPAGPRLRRAAVSIARIESAMRSGFARLDRSARLPWERS